MLKQAYWSVVIKGCLECFACKRKGIETGGICVIKDSFRPILEKVYNADVVIIGSPNFFGYPSAMTRAFIERFLFLQHETQFPKDEEACFEMGKLLVVKAKELNR